MDPARMIELSREAADKLERLAEIRQKAKNENRDLSRREAAEIDRIKKEAEELQRQLPRYDGRIFQTRGARSVPDNEQEPHLLQPGDSFAAHVRERRGGYVGDFGERGYDDGSLGRVLGALISGDRSHLSEIEQRAMAEGAGSGQYLIAPELSSMVIDAARAHAVAFKAGAMTLEMHEPITYIPRLDTPVVAEWHAENEALAGSDQGWSRVTLSAKTVVAGPLKLSRELWEDTDGTEAGRVIADDLAKQLALALDLAVFEGIGASNEPLGIASTTGVNELAMPGADGSAPTSYDEIVKAVYAVQAANGPMSTAAVMHPTIAEAYALLVDSLGQPLRRPEAIATLPFLTTSQLKSTRTVGTSTDASNVYLGDFSQVVVGFRPNVQVRTQVLEERFADTLSVGILAWLRCDVAVRRPEFLSIISGVLPPA